MVHLVSVAERARRHLLETLAQEEGPGLLALRHALLFQREGVWVDNCQRPRTAILIRPGDGCREAFAVGRPGPAIPWLAARGGRFALVAPDEWEPWIRATVGEVERAEVQTWFDPPRDDPSPPPPGIKIRRLDRIDLLTFMDTTPPWALRAWTSYPELLEHAAAFGLPYTMRRPWRTVFASMAWIFDQTERFDAIAVYTMPHYRRLGLGRIAARALIQHIIHERGKIPLWSAASDNTASIALARSLGFTKSVSEPLLRWPVGPVEEREF